VGVRLRRNSGSIPARLLVARYGHRVRPQSGTDRVGVRISLAAPKSLCCELPGGGSRSASLSTGWPPRSLPARSWRAFSSIASGTGLPRMLGRSRRRTLSGLSVERIFPAVPNGRRACPADDETSESSATSQSRQHREEQGCSVVRAPGSRRLAGSQAVSRYTRTSRSQPVLLLRRTNTRLRWRRPGLRIRSHAARPLRRSRPAYLPQDPPREQHAPPRSDRRRSPLA
jgi:hypothetical protein